MTTLLNVMHERLSGLEDRNKFLHQRLDQQKDVKSGL